MISVGKGAMTSAGKGGGCHDNCWEGGRVPWQQQGRVKAAMTTTGKGEEYHDNSRDVDLCDDFEVRTTVK